MPCYMCKSKIGPFQRLEIARLRFIRKAQPLFRDDSYLCSRCFKQFETIYKSKSKSKSINDTNSTRTSISNASSKSVSSDSHQSKNSSRDKSVVTAIKRSDGINNSNSDNSSVVSILHIDSRSMDTPSSIDSTDRIVQLSPTFLSIRDSTRKTTRNPNINVAREQAEGAVQIASEQQMTSATENTPPTSHEEGENNSHDSSPPLINFQSGSMHSHSSDDTIDKIVQMEPNFISLRDSSRKTTRNPEMNIARQEAEAAVRNTSKRPKTTQSNKTPMRTPIVSRRGPLDIVDEESSGDEDLAATLSPNNLAHVRPVVRRRKQPAVQQFDDIMDLYIARTSGG